MNVRNTFTAKVAAFKLPYTFTDIKFHNNGANLSPLGHRRPISPTEFSRIEKRSI